MNSSSFFSDLEALIAQQAIGNPHAPSVLRSLGVPSLSIAVLSNHSISAHTISDDASPIDTETVFQAASISKPIFGLAVFRAIQQGRLSLSASIGDYLSADQLEIIETSETADLVRYITIGHLLTHTSGLSVHGFEGYRLDEKVPSIEVLLAGGSGSNSPHVRLERPPGLRHDYSGGGFTVLQLILQTIFSKTLSDIVQELVLEPLSMTRSFYAFREEDKNYAKAFSTGVTPATEGPYHKFPEAAAAGLWTTPTDLLKAGRALRDSYLGRSTFLSQDLAQLLLTNVDGASGYVNGGWVFPEDSNSFGHGGSNDPGYRCGLAVALDRESQNLMQGSQPLGSADSEGFAIMTSSSLGFEVALKLVHAIGYLRGWPGNDKLHWSTVSSKLYAVPLVAPDVTPAAAWKEWQGSWKFEESSKQYKDGQIFRLDADDTGKPVLLLDGLPAINLLAAAISPRSYSSGKPQSIDLVANGLEMMFRLGFKEPEGEEHTEEPDKTLELWTAWNAEPDTLIREE